MALPLAAASPVIHCKPGKRFWIKWNYCLPGLSIAPGFMADQARHDGKKKNKNSI
jgi:hypothetical protein